MNVEQSLRLIAGIVVLASLLMGSKKLLDLKRRIAKRFRFNSLKIIAVEIADTLFLKKLISAFSLK